jgi:hypothetical protein
LVLILKQGKNMKTIARIVAFIAFIIVTSMATAQSIAPTNLYLGGISYNNAASPAIGGTGLYARLLTDKTYAFAIVDALPETYKPLTITTSVSAGIAQKIATIDGHPVYVPTSAGVSITGDNTNWAWSTGVAVPFVVKKNWYVMPNVRAAKSGNTYLPIVGVLFGWGQ